MDIELEKVSVLELDPTKTYIVSVEVGDMPLEEVAIFLKKIKAKFEQVSPEINPSNFIYIPCRNGTPSVTVTELKTYINTHFNNDDVEIKAEEE